MQPKKICIHSLSHGLFQNCSNISTHAFSAAELLLLENEVPSLSFSEIYSEFIDLILEMH